MTLRETITAALAGDAEAARDLLLRADLWAGISPEDLPAHLLRPLVVRGLYDALLDRLVHTTGSDRYTRLLGWPDQSDVSDNLTQWGSATAARHIAAERVIDEVLVELVFAAEGDES